MHKLFLLDRIGDSALLTDSCKTDLLRHAHVGHIREDEFYQRGKDLSPVLLLTTSGIGRVFIETHDGRDVTQHFLRAEDFIVANQHDARGTVERVQAITDLSYVALPYEKLEAMLADHVCLFDFLASIGNERALRMQERTRRFASSGALETYESFLQTHPGLETQVPTVHLASYLGLTTSQFMRARQQHRSRGIM